MPLQAGNTEAETYAAIDDAAMHQQPANVMRYRDETIQLVKEALLSDRQEPSKPSSDPAIQSFWDIGTSIRSRGSSGTNTLPCSFWHIPLTC